MRRARIVGARPAPAFSTSTAASCLATTLFVLPFSPAKDMNIGFLKYSSTLSVIAI